MYMSLLITTYKYHCMLHITQYKTIKDFKKMERSLLIFEYLNMFSYIDTL